MYCFMHFNGQMIKCCIQLFEKDFVTSCSLKLLRSIDISYVINRNLTVKDRQQVIMPVLLWLQYNGYYYVLPKDP